MVSEINSQRLHFYNKMSTSGEPRKLRARVSGAAALSLAPAVLVFFIPARSRGIFKSVMSNQRNVRASVRASVRVRASMVIRRFLTVYGDPLNRAF